MRVEGGGSETEGHYVRKRMWKVIMQHGNVLDCRQPIQAPPRTSGVKKGLEETKKNSTRGTDTCQAAA